MAKQHAKAFHEKVNSDAALRKRIREAGRSASEAIVRIGKEHGLDFTHEELKQVLHESWGKATPASDEDGPSTCFMVSERPGV